MSRKADSVQRGWSDCWHYVFSSKVGREKKNNKRDWQIGNLPAEVISTYYPPIAAAAAAAVMLSLVLVSIVIDTPSYTVNIQDIPNAD